jgi:hypothetical protein
VSGIRRVSVGQFDRWDFILRDHLHYVVMRTARRNGGWLPDLPKSRIDYLQRKFRGRWMVVKCGDDWSFHVIAVSRRGRIALFDHPDWRREYNFGQLGGKMPNCLHIAAAMFDPKERPYVGDFPEAINEYCHEQMNKHAVRTKSSLYGHWPWPHYGEPLT